MFYRIHATARETQQKTCSRMKDTFVPVLPNPIAEGPIELEVIKAEQAARSSASYTPEEPHSFPTGRTGTHYDN